MDRQEPNGPKLHGIAAYFFKVGRLPDPPRTTGAAASLSANPASRDWRRERTRSDRSSPSARCESERIFAFLPTLIQPKR